MAKKKTEVSTPVVRQVKESYKPRFNIPKGNPDRHVVRMAGKTWLVIQPGNTTFIGQFSSKDDALVMAERHVAVTKGSITVH